MPEPRKSPQAPSIASIVLEELAACIDTGTEPALCPGTQGQRNGGTANVLLCLTLAGCYNRPYIVLQFPSWTRFHFSCRGPRACQTQSQFELARFVHVLHIPAEIFFIFFDTFLPKPQAWTLQEHVFFFFRQLSGCFVFKARQHFNMPEALLLNTA